MSKPVVEYEERPVFDKATGQLKIERVKVERTKEETEDAMLAAVNREAPSSKRPKPMQRYDKAEGERTHFFRDDANAQTLNDLVAAERRGESGVGAVDANHSRHVATGDVIASEEVVGLCGGAPASKL